MLHGKLFMIGQGRFMSQCDNKINSRSTFIWLLAQDMTLGVNQKSLKKRFMLDFGGHRFNVFKSPEPATLIAISSPSVRVIV